MQKSQTVARTRMISDEEKGKQRQSLETKGILINLRTHLGKFFVNIFNVCKDFLVCGQTISDWQHANS